MRAALIVVLATAAFAQQAPEAAEQTRIIGQAREAALRYSSTLPDFICTETMTRFRQKQRDVLVIDLAYSAQGERYKLRTIDGKPSDKPLSKAGGFNSRGEFASLLLHVFEPRTNAPFQWERTETAGGRLFHVFSYAVDQAHSHFAMNFGGILGGRRVVLPFHGLAFIDAETYRVHRLTYEVDEYPRSAPARSSSGYLEYADTLVAGTAYLLPRRTGQKLILRKGGDVRNEIEFTDYRKFSAETTLTFERP